MDAVAILQLHAIVHSKPSFVEAATALATELARLQGAVRVCLGFVDDGYAEVVAVSIAYPGWPGERARVTLAHAELARRDATTACSIPLVNLGRVIGAITLEYPGGSAVERTRLTACENAACMLAPTLELKRNAGLRWRQRLRRGWRGVREGARKPGQVAMKLACLAAFAGMAALSAMPVDYRVGAPARLEGSIQRALVAPTDGFLRQAHVKPGDQVVTGQVLAELADQDLAIESRKWRSELAQHENTSRAALARGDRTQYVIYQGKADEARAQLDLVEQQLARGRIRAPFDGVLIKGDLTQMLGAPVQRGDVLLTVAPAHQFRLIVEVDERDIADIKPGATGEVALAALPGETTRFQIVRVTPVATSREGRNFYEVEGGLADGHESAGRVGQGLAGAASASLRPGLQGVAKINAGQRPVAWIWGHRLVDWARLAIWTFGA
jgi:multidrug resistance efflux pump